MWWPYDSQHVRSDVQTVARSGRLYAVVRRAVVVVEEGREAGEMQAMLARKRTLKLELRRHVRDFAQKPDVTLQQELEVGRHAQRLETDAVWERNSLDDLNPSRPLFARPLRVGQLLDERDTRPNLVRRRASESSQRPPGGPKELSHTNARGGSGRVWLEGAHHWLEGLKEPLGDGVHEAAWQGGVPGSARQGVLPRGKAEWSS